MQATPTPRLATAADAHTLADLAARGDSCPHAAGAALGALAAQEGIKLLTGQFVPLRGTFVLDLARVQGGVVDV